MNIYYNNFSEIKLLTTCHYGIVYWIHNEQDTSELKSGYIGKSINNVNTLDVYKLTRPGLSFMNFNEPYAGRKLEDARESLPQEGWKIELLCVVESYYMLEMENEVFNQEEKFILEKDTVNKGYNTTYGGRHGYKKPWIHQPTKPMMEEYYKQSMEDLPKDTTITKFDFSICEGLSEASLYRLFEYSLVAVKFNKKKELLEHLNNEIEKYNTWHKNKRKIEKLPEEFIDDLIKEIPLSELKENKEEEKDVYYLTDEMISALIRLLCNGDLMLGVDIGYRREMPELNLSLRSYRKWYYSNSVFCYRLKTLPGGKKELVEYESKKDLMQDNKMSYYDLKVALENGACGVGVGRFDDFAQHEKEEFTKNSSNLIRKML